MDTSTKNLKGLPVRLWGLTAARSATVAIIARATATDGRWSHILKWDYKRGQIQPGVWSRLDIKAHRCRLSPDGEFMMYTAKGPLGGPFDASYGGGIAISRLPWLTALTFINPACIGGGGPSRDMLPRDQQHKLWQHFQEPYYILDEGWPAHLGREWERAGSEVATSLLPRIVGDGHRSWLLARAPLAGRGLELLAITRRDHVRDELPRHPRYHLYDPGADQLNPLSGIHWAAPTREPRARILAATQDAHIQMLTPVIPDPAAALRIEQDHDLSNLVPDPSPAPSWATTPL